MRTTYPTKVPGLPNIPPDTSPAMRRYLEAVAEAVEIRLGRKGDPRDRAITARDLLESGLAVESPLQLGNGGLPTIQPPGLTNSKVDLPLAPTGFTATGAYSLIILEWDNPRDRYNGHATTEIWRHDQDVLGDAVLVGVSFGFMYVDQVGGDQGYYYWVRHVNVENKHGAFNSSSGTYAETAPDVDALLDILYQAITEDELTLTLKSKIDQIAIIDAALTTVETDLLQAQADITQAQGDISTAQTAIANAQTLIGNNANNITSLQQVTAGHTVSLTNLNTTVGANSSNIATLQQTTATNAQDISALETTVFDPTTGVAANTTAIGGLTTSVSNINGTINAHSSDITQLQTDLTNTNTNVTANANGLSTLSTTVTSQGNTISSHSSDITTLNNTVYDANTGVTATATALSNLSSTVTQQGNDISANSSDITSLENTVNDPNTGVAAQATALSGLTTTVTSQGNSISSNSSDITVLQNTVNNPTTGLAATSSAVTNLTSTVTSQGNSISANASSITSLSTTVGSHTTSINQNIASINGIQGEYSLTVDSNGNVAGYGLINNSTTYSRFYVNADLFALVAPGNNPTASTSTLPFAVVTSSITQNGVTVPAGTYINTAMIANGSIDTARIGLLAVDTAQIADAAIAEAKIDNLAVTTGKIGNLAVETAKIANAAITFAKIGNAQVDTLKIAGEAVVVPRGSSGSGGTIYSSASNWTQIGSLSIQWGSDTSDIPSQVIVFASANQLATQSGTTQVTRAMRIQADTGGVSSSFAGAESGVSTYQGWSNSHAAGFTHTGTTGYITYRLLARTTGANSLAGSWNITVMGGKR